MAKFLNSSGITYYLENLIKNAETHLVIISPYIKFNLRIKQLLDERNSFKFNTTLIYGKTDLQTEESDWLKSKEFIKVKFCENLHAKCYINEKEAIITSMNLYDFSQQNNNEMGIYVNKNDSSELYNDIEKEVDRLIRISELISDSIEKVKFEKNIIDIDGGLTHKKLKNDDDRDKADTDLFGKLKSLRSQIAHKKNVPAYYIFNDSSLIEMTLHLPKNKKEFLKINGVGQQKLNEFGDLFLDLIAKEKSFNKKPYKKDSCYSKPYNPTTKIKKNNSNIYDNASYKKRTSNTKIKQRNKANGGCFIATAAYGTPFAEEINILRFWRDTFLLKYYLGNLFVKFYYKTSPSIANFIRDKDWMKNIVKFFLNPFIKLLNKYYKN